MDAQHSASKHAIPTNWWLSQLPIAALLALALGCAGQVEPTGGAADAGVSYADADPFAPDASSNSECYSELIYDDFDIDDIIASYGGTGYKEQVIEAVRRQWPGGELLLETMKDNQYFAQFSSDSSWADTASDLGTLVHEMTHLFNYQYARDEGLSHALYFRGDLIMPLPNDDAGFARSEIIPLMSTQVRDGLYVDTYFTGEQGTRKLNALLDELSCYTAELAIGPIYGTYFEGYGISLRDGSVAFLHYLQLYLRLARTDYPSYYAAAKADPQIVEAVKQSWLRAHYYWPYAAAFPSIGVDDEMYREELYKPANLAEIEMFIGAKVGDSNCTNP